MMSKNKPRPSAKAQKHIARLKEQPCACCDTVAAELEIHEIKQGDWFTSIGLCADCHRGAKNGLHGQRAMWKLYKLDELGALSKAIERLYE